MEENIGTKKEQKKTPWYKRKKWWNNLLENILATIGIIIVLCFMMLMFDLLGEGLSRDKYIKSVEPVVITAIYDNSVPQFRDGDQIQSKQYLYYIDYADSTGVLHRQEIYRWSPWLTDTVYGVKVGDTVNLYRFHSKGVFGLNGSRLVFEKGGNYYE